MNTLLKIGLTIWGLLIFVGIYNSFNDHPYLEKYKEQLTRQEKYGSHMETYYQTIGDVQIPFQQEVDDYRTVGTGVWVDKERVHHESVIYSPIVGFFYGGIIFAGGYLLVLVCSFFNP